MAKSRPLIVSIFLSAFLVSVPCFSEEPHVYDRIVITSHESRLSFLDFLEGHYATQVIRSQELNQKPTASLVDLLDDVGSVDLRYRGTSGIQADLSIRGSTFEQVAVLIEGVRVNDPQTGHHNLDIPLTRFDVEEIEVIKEGASSLLGAGALAGSINFAIKKPTKKALNIETLFGEHALFGKALSFSWPSEKIASRLSFEHKTSKAARPHTDFEYKTGSFYLARTFPEATADVLLGYQKKDFGADSFYSNLFPEEEEHTSTFFIKTGLDNKLSFGLLKSSVHLRKHRDKFILNRNNPTFVNYHTTYSYGLGSELEVPLERGDFLLGADGGGEQIDSTNLGKHTRQYGSLSFGLMRRLQDNLTAEAQLRFQEYQEWGFQESYHMALNYFIIDETLRINGSLGHAFRIPSFTELYYSDAANRGNEDLAVEESDHFRLGLAFKEGKTSWGVDAFLRHGRNLIDWTRASESQIWTATNLGRVDYSGLEFNFKLEPVLGFRQAEFKKIAFSYTYMDSNKKETGFLSKYALDILRHQLIMGIDSEILGIHLNWQLSYHQRCFGETYFIGDFVMSKRIRAKDFILEPFLKIDNFSDTHYREVGGVLQPGRWVQGGVRFEW
jgi:vitamin B12 transporter